MHRALQIVSVLAVVLLTLLIANRSLSSDAQDATAIDRHELVGSWRLTVTETQAPPFLALATFGADGTALFRAMACCSCCPDRLSVAVASVSHDAETVDPVSANDSVRTETKLTRKSPF